MGKTLLALIGAYDNLDEAPDVMNHPENIIAYTIGFMALSWICASLRLYTRFFILRCPGWDDLFVILSLISVALGSSAICLAVTHGGMGRHFILLGQPTITRYLKIYYVANATYPASTGFIKLSLLFQYLRVYDSFGRRCVFRKATVVSIYLVAIWSFVYAILAWVPTLPVSGYWDFTRPAIRYAFGTQDADVFVATYTSIMATSMLFDLIIMCLAIPLFLSQNAGGESSRWALLALFIVGSTVSVLSILRLAATVQTRATTWPTFDPTWYGPKPIVLAALETDVAIISASLPVFWPVLCNLPLNIVVTREVNVTLEHRRLSGGLMRGSGGAASKGAGNRDPEDDTVAVLHQGEQGELDIVESGGGAGGGGAGVLPHLQLERPQQASVRGSRLDHYGDPYIAQQVSPLSKTEFGVTYEIGGAPNARI